MQAKSEAAAAAASFDKTRLHDCCMTASRQLLYRQYFRGMDEVNSYKGTARPDRRKFRAWQPKQFSRVSPKLHHEISKRSFSVFSHHREDLALLARSNQVQNFKRTHERARTKSKIYKQEIVSLKSHLCALKQQLSSVQSLFDASTEKLNSLRLQEHNLNLEYALIENEQNCILFPL